MKKSDDYFKGLADGFNLGCDILDMVLGRKSGKRLTYKQAMRIPQTSLESKKYSKRAKKAWVTRRKKQKYPDTAESGTTYDKEQAFKNDKPPPEPWESK